MFKIGIRGHDLVAKGTVEDLALEMKKLDLHYLQLVFPKSFKDYSYSIDYVKHVSDVLKENDIKVSMLGAYFNPVHSNKEVVKNGIENFEHNLDIMHIIPTSLVGSETGSFNDHPWIYVPKNRTEEGYLQSKAVFEQLVKYAFKANGNIAIEPAFGHVMYSVEVLKRLVDELDSKNVFVTIDLYNLLDASNFEKRDEIFFQALKTFNNKIKIIHLKDGKVIEGKLKQFAPGKGDFHYDFMLDLITKYCPDVTLIFEGVLKEDVPFSLNFIKNLIKI